MKVFLKLFLPVLLVFATYSVSYGDEYVDEEVSWYLGALTLYAFEDFFDEPLEFGLGAKWGVRFDTPSNEIDLALELNFVWYDTVDQDDPTGAKIAEIDMWYLTLRPKLYFSGIAGGRFAPYVYAGAGYMEADRKITAGIDIGAEKSSSGFVFELGTGLEVAITNFVWVFTEVGYVEPTGDLDGLSHWTVGGGILFRF